MRTRDTVSVRIPPWLAVLIVGLPLLLAGCQGGSGSPAGTDDPQESESSQDGAEDADDSDDSDDSREDDEEVVAYEWGLPSSDTSVGEDHQGAEGSAYQALQRSCSEGAQFLSTDFAPEYGFESPRNVLLFAAGVQLCNGDSDTASALFEHAQALGADGLTPEAWAFCDLYRTVRSVLEQRAPEEFTCGDGSAPPFRVGDNGTADDPLTLDVDESAADSDSDLDGETETETDTGPDPTPGTSTEPAP